MLFILQGRTLKYKGELQDKSHPINPKVTEGLRVPKIRKAKVRQETTESGTVRKFQKSQLPSSHGRKEHRGGVRIEADINVTA